MNSFDKDSRTKERFFTEYWDNGNKREQGTLLDGRLIGLWTFWYENGQKKSEITYKNDVEVQ